MSTMFRTAMLAALFLVGGQPAQAQWRCDCTSVTGSCQANVEVKGNWIEVTADTETCARVDYFVDGLPFVSLVVDGTDRQDWQSRNEDPNVLVQSCQICRETSSGEPAPASPTAEVTETEDGSPIPLIKVAPDYPERALINGIEGYVTVEFGVNAEGRVEQPRVIDAKPQRLFDQAALTAVRRWRFKERPGDSPTVTLTEQVSFKLGQAGRTREGVAREVRTRARSVRRPRNDCLRESASYDYGDMVEVGFINACEIPIVVYACSLGTGSASGRWVCLTPEQNSTALIKKNLDPLDQRIVATMGPGLAYRQDQFLMRAPNSQYWWIACEANDPDCRAAGREWASDVQSAPATLDPRGAARIDVSRSR